MKRAMAVLAIVLLAAGVAWGEPDVKPDEKNGPIDTRLECLGPIKWKLEWNDCRDCHIIRGGFALKEMPKFAGRDIPDNVTWVENGTAVFTVDEDITPLMCNRLIGALRWASDRNMKRLVLEMHSPGGSLLDAWRMVGFINEYREKMVIETRVYGFAASAAFILWMAGDNGKRFVSPTAELMTHELWTIAWLKVETPSSSENSAETMRHLQDTIHIWMAKRCKMSKEELDKKVKHVDFWLRGSEAVSMGFADGYIGKE